MYAENARGKTTLVSIFRSLQTGDPLPIRERRRLGGTRAAQVALAFSDEANAMVFQDGQWSAAKANIAVFDEQFINDNVYSGLVVQSPQREGLHGLIVGARGVALLRSLQTEVDAIEKHNVQLRTLAATIPQKALRGLTIDQFCELPRLEDIDARIEEAGKAVSAAQQQEAITKMRALEELPAIELPPEAIETLLREQLPDVAAEAERRVSAHLQRLGLGGEAWVAQGQRIQHEHRAELGEDCPYCAQSLAPSALAQAYSQHFSATYNELKAKIQRTIQRLDQIYGATALDRIRAQFSENSSKSLFWSEFIDAPQLEADVEAFLAAAIRARDSLLQQLKQKAEAPLEAFSLSTGTQEALHALTVQCRTIDEYNSRVREINEKAAAVREAVSVTSLQTLRDDLARLEAGKDRFDPSIDAKCSAYLSEKAAKKSTESRRSARKRALDAHLQNVFPAFQEAINLYLRRLNAGFRIDGVKSLNTRRGPSCVYSVVIDNSPNHPVSVNSDAIGEPSFKTVLSTSDRNTLALAVFLASISQDEERPQKVVVIDDPINSLDEHRAFATVSEIRRLAAEVEQVIVLSHSRPLVCHLWESPGQIGRIAIEVARSGAGSTLRIWDVSTHGVTEHDKRHAKLRTYLDNQVDNPREVAEAIRPTLEAFLRVAYPEHFPPGTLLGRFRLIASQHVGGATQILCQNDVDELATLTDYANRFHHDTNPAWQTADINDAELLAFVRRVVAFTKRA
ncbi:AAA family ATPase [Allosphingosinicella flava]|uniref:AAA family ATPase n=1 Tax=Allosphingosinicella flava TaxID=2771430 RepID=A0A7T2LL95_9SPHN|nr:AAA family ATPase [Sphingosinicella flava]